MQPVNTAARLDASHIGIDLDLKLKIMKPILKFSTLAIFAILFSLAPFVRNAGAQTSGVNKKDKNEQQEIHKFVMSFLQSLEEIKDLNRVPQRFFVSDFKSRFSQKVRGLRIVNNKLFTGLSEDERYEYNVVAFNLEYLRLMDLFAKSSNEFKGLDEIDNYIPPYVLKAVKKSKVLSSIKQGDDFEIQNIEDFRILLSEVRNVVELQRTYLNNRALRLKNRYAQNINSLRKEDEYWSSKLCSGENCEGFPQNTRIIDYRGYPIFFDLVKEDSGLKIFDLYIQATD